MVKLACSYCQVDLNDGAGYKGVSFRYGILHCPAHEEDAKRDIHNFMHATGVARIGDVLEHPDTKPFFEMIQGGIRVILSDGTEDSGWKLLDDPSNFPNILQKQAGVWVAPFYKDDAVKAVKLTDIFTSTENCAGMPQDFQQRLDVALKALHKGLYADPAIPYRILGWVDSKQ